MHTNERNGEGAPTPFGRGKNPDSNKMMMMKIFNVLFLPNIAKYAIVNELKYVISFQYLFLYNFIWMNFHGVIILS